MLIQSHTTSLNFLDWWRRRCLGPQRWSDWLAIAAACIFVLLAAYHIELPGLNYDELEFANAAQGGPDNTWIFMRLGSTPLLISPYVGALKAWIYFPIFHFFGVSALTVRLPVILLGAVTLLLFYLAMRGTLGATWAAIAVWIMAFDPANLFPTRLDSGLTAVMHLFQAAILALWFSYRNKPRLWKAAFIFLCFVLGTFDKFNFVWLLLAFLIGIFACYPDEARNLWSSLPRFIRWAAAILAVIGPATMLYLILPFRHRFLAWPVTTGRGNWSALLAALSGSAEASSIFESPAGIISVVPGWLIAMDGLLVLACFFLPVSNAKARENRKAGTFCLLVGLLIFLQIAITPGAGGPYHPHHYSMIFPFPFLAFAFLASCLRAHFDTKHRYLVTALVSSFALCLFLANDHNTAVYLSRLQKNGHYSPQWSPEIYRLSSYINEHGSDSGRIISVDWGLHNQIHALAPKYLRQRMREFTPIFRTLDRKPEEERSALLPFIFPEGKSFVITFAASMEKFPETRRNFLGLLVTHPELHSRLLKEFSLAGEKVYELYEVSRSVQ